MQLSRSTLSLTLFGLCLSLTSCSQRESSAPESQTKPQTSPAQEEQSIRTLDAAWGQAIAAKDPDKTASFYADSANLLAPAAKIATGKDAIHKSWSDLMATPGFALTFAPNTIQVSQSGDLAYDLGTWQMTGKDKKGKSQTSTGVYVVVWGKQPDGSWKALVDSPTTTTP